MNQIVTWFMWMGIIPAAVAGLVIAHFRITYLTVVIPERFRCGI